MFGLRSILSEIKHIFFFCKSGNYGYNFTWPNSHLEYLFGKKYKGRIHLFEKARLFVLFLYEALGVIGFSVSIWQLQLSTGERAPILDRWDLKLPSQRLKLIQETNGQKICITIHRDNYNQTNNITYKASCLLYTFPSPNFFKCSVYFETYSIPWHDIERHRWGFQNFNRQSQYITVYCSQFPYLLSSDTSEVFLPSQEQPVMLHTELISNSYYFIMRMVRKIGNISYILTDVHISAFLWQSDTRLLEIIMIALLHDSVSTFSFLINIIYLVCKYSHLDMIVAVVLSVFVIESAKFCHCLKAMPVNPM